MKIIIPEWMKEESPVCAGFCEVINAALEENPNMSLADFATSIDYANKEKGRERIQRVEKRQFGGFTV